MPSPDDPCGFWGCGGGGEEEEGLVARFKAKKWKPKSVSNGFILDASARQLAELASASPGQAKALSTAMHLSRKESGYAGVGHMVVGGERFTSFVEWIDAENVVITTLSATPNGAESEMKAQFRKIGTQRTQDGAEVPVFALAKRSIASVPGNFTRK